MEYPETVLQTAFHLKIWRLRAAVAEPRNKKLSRLFQAILGLQSQLAAIVVERPLVGNHLGQGVFVGIANLVLCLVDCVDMPVAVLLVKVLGPQCLIALELVQIKDDFFLLSNSLVKAHPVVVTLCAILHRFWLVVLQVVAL